MSVKVGLDFGTSNSGVRQRAARSSARSVVRFDA